ncbi:MAG: HDOD domain-containing protein [Acidovorax sp.]
MSFLRDFFHRLLGRNRSKPQPPQAQAGQRQFQALDQIAPLQSAPRAQAAPAARNNATFICREPVLNRSEQIAGYFFHLHGHLQARLQGKNEQLHKAYDDALLRSLATLRVHSLLGHRKAFIHLNPASLNNPLLAQLPARNSVLMLAPDLQGLDLATLQSRLAALRQRGMAHGWVLNGNLAALHPALHELAPQGDYVQIDTARFNGLEIEALHETLGRGPAQRAPQQWIAQELRSFDEFNLCFKGGFDFFMGGFVSSRENWHPPRSEINRLLAIKLLQLLRGDEDLGAIAQQITADPVLSFKLLRHVNSPAFNLAQPLLTIDKAVMVLGRERCYRWVSLLLFDIQQSGYRERLLIEHALTRAFFLESLAGHGQVAQGTQDALFILGLFSMLDLLMGHPLEAILQETHLPAPVHEALLGQAGAYRNALLLAQALEKHQFNAAAALVERLQLDGLPVQGLHLEALGKANDLIEMSR